MTGDKYAAANHALADRLKPLLERFPKLRAGLAVALDDLGYGRGDTVLGDDIAFLDDAAEALIKARGREPIAEDDARALYGAYLLVKLRRVRQEFAP